MAYKMAVDWAMAQTGVVAAEANRTGSSGAKIAAEQVARIGFGPGAGAFVFSVAPGVRIADGCSWGSGAVGRCALARMGSCSFCSFPRLNEMGYLNNRFL